MAKRLMKEKKQLEDEPLDNATAGPDGKGLLHLQLLTAACLLIIKAYSPAHNPRPTHGLLTCFVRSRNTPPPFLLPGRAIHCSLVLLPPLPPIDPPADEANMLLWTAMIMGPDTTPYADGVFNVEMIFPAEYPFKPPKVKFTTKIYHPNVKSTGDICMDAINDGWSPTCNVKYVQRRGSEESAKRQRRGSGAG